MVLQCRYTKYASISVFGFAGISTKKTTLIVIIFSCLNFIVGISRAGIETLGQVLIAEHTHDAQKRTAFSFRYTAANIGVALGPVIGAYLGLSGTLTGFFFTGGLLWMYFFIFLLFLIFFYKRKMFNPVPSSASFLSSLRMLAKDKALGNFIIGGILIYCVFVQQETLFGIIISKQTGNLYYFSALLTFNAVLVILFQVPIVKLFENISPLKGMMLGAILLAIGITGIAFSNTSFWAYMGSEVIFTLGEILIFPLTGLVIDNLAPENLRGIYFGANTFQFLGKAIGPAIGGTLLQHSNIQVTLVTMGFLSLVSIVFYYRGFIFSENAESQLINLDLQKE